MVRFARALSEERVGVREARQRISELLDAAGAGDRVIHVTRRGECVAAIVSPNVAEGLVAVQGNGGPVIPGDVVEVIKLLESFLSDRDMRLPQEADTRPNEFIGGCMTLVDAMMVAPELNFGEINLLDDEGNVSGVGVMAEFLTSCLYNSDVHPGVREKLPLVAGSLWAVQLNGSAAEYRRQIPVEVTGQEGFLWVIALRNMCELINDIHGAGSAEDLMYRIEEAIRELADEVPNGV